MTSSECDRIVARLRRGWTKGALARDVAGVPCFTASICAVAWCTAGAAIAEAVELPWGDSAPLWVDLNDAPSTTLDDVIAALRSAVAEGGAV